VVFDMRKGLTPDSGVVYASTTAIVTRHATSMQEEYRLAPSLLSTAITISYGRNTLVVLRYLHGIHLVKSSLESGEWLPYR